MRRVSSNKREDVYIHRIIAEMFIENPLNKEQVNHIDCNRQNNDVNNLEWVTVKENIEHAMTYGDLMRNELGQYARKN